MTPSAKPKGKLPFHTSPKGRFKWPRLVVPDTKFDKDGRYSVGLLLSSAAAGALIQKLQPLHEEAVAAAEALREEKLATCKTEAQKRQVKPIEVNPFFGEDLDKDTGEPTGETIFRFGVKAKGVSRKKGTPEEFMRKIALFDAKGHPIRDDNLEIWSGTVGRVTFVAVPYYVPATGATGLSLRPVAVQVIELVTKGSGKSAGAYGFDEEEDGFEYQEDSGASAPDDPGSESGGVPTAEGEGLDF